VLEVILIRNIAQIRPAVKKQQIHHGDMESIEKSMEKKI
jgi:hypothetical protein